MQFSPAKRPATKPCRQQQSGLALLLLVAVLAAASLYALVSGLERRSLSTARLQDTGQSLQQARDALLAYAASYPDSHAQTDAFGHLPCPDLSGDGSATANCGARGVTVIGLLPYKTLGLPDLRDSAGNCLWYAVSGSHKNDQPVTNAQGLTTLNWDTQANITIQNANGTATLAAPDDAGGGAAAVIFAIGPSAAGQTRNNDPERTCGLKAADISGLNGEGYANFIARDLVRGYGNFSDNPVSVIVRAGSPDNPDNRNVLAWLTPRDVFNRVKGRKGNASTEFVGRLSLLTDQLANSLSSGTSLPDPAGTVTTVGQLTYGLPPDPASAAALPDLPTLQAADFARWSGQYRYARCTSGNKCINNGSCAGVLLFAGERKLSGETPPRGSPRSGSEYNDYELTTLFDDDNRRNLLQGGTTFARTAGGMGLSSGGVTLAGSSFNISNPNLPASDDDVICLNPAVSSFSIDDGVSSFRSVGTTGGAQVLVSTQESRLLLGTTSSTPISACSWHPAALNISNGLRAYFRFRIDSRGEGFTFALADSSANTSINMCGKGDNALGYSGSGTLTNPIKPPKLALEFDTSKEGSRNDPSNNHVALVYWAGNSPSDDKDNTHGQCALPGNTPCNPTDSSGVRNLSMLDQTGVDIYVRLDMKLASTSGNNRTYQLVAYISKDINFREQCELNGDSNGDLTADVTICSPSLNTTLTTTMSTAYLGFTMGQNSNSQNIVIRDFKARGR